MRKAILPIFLLVVLGAVYLMWDSDPPEISLQTPAEVGTESAIILGIEDRGRGLESVSVVIRQGDYTRKLFEKVNPVSWLPWKHSESSVQVELGPDDWLDRQQLKEGTFTLEVSAGDAGDYGFFSDSVMQNLEMDLDRTPPGIEVLSSQHNVRRGGAESVRYRVKGDGSSSGVRVGGNSFQGYPVEGGGAGEYAVIFVWSHEQPADVPVKIWAEDRVGNRSEITLPCQKIERRFRNRRINVSESFIDRVTPEIIRLSPDVEEQENKLQTYLLINQDLRVLNNRRLVEVTTPVSGGIAWDEAFLQMRNSKVEALFADHRDYYFNGEKVDEQVHLGYDLASTAQSPVEAANDGRVVFAENLGIYGNCIVLDHGLGLYSLYGHLSSMDVEPGTAVRRGEIIGRTGQTGLAGGDHLHYSMLVQGVQTNPLEWWDPGWVQLHVLQRTRASVAEDETAGS